MDKERKVYRGIIIGCLVMVLSLTVWTINIDDTYSTDATSASPSPEDNCDPGYHLSNGHCCSIGYDWMDDPDGDGRGERCYYNGKKNEQCYFCTGVPAYTWSLDVPSSGCTGGTWEPVPKSYADCKLTNTTPTPTSCGDGEHLSYGHCCPIGEVWKATKGCATDRCISGYYFVPGSGGTCCKIGTVWDSDNDNCIETDDGKQCYFCTGTPAYAWSLDVPSSGCNGGTWEPVSKSKNECKSTSTTPTPSSTTPTTPSVTPTKSGTNPTTPGITPTKSGTTPTPTPSNITPSTPSVTPKIYKVTFYPNGGIWQDGTAGSKTIEYTSELYFSNSKLKIVREGYTLKGWQNEDGAVFTVRIDSSNNNDALTAIWQENNSSGGGSTTIPGIGNEEQCNFISKDSCEITYNGFNCIKDKNNCYIKGNKKNDLSDAPVSNPNTGNSMIYISIIFGIAALGYTIYYLYNLKKNLSNTKQ